MRPVNLPHRQRRAWLAATRVSGHTCAAQGHGEGVRHAGGALRRTRVLQQALEELNGHVVHKDGQAAVQVTQADGPPEVAGVFACVHVRMGWPRGNGGGMWCGARVR